MQKTDAPRLVARILFEPWQRARIPCVLSDEGVFASLLRERLEREAPGAKAIVFSGKAPASAFLEHASQGGMFEEPEPCLVHWTEKISAKQWEAELAFLRRLPTPPPLLCAFLLPTSARAILKPTDLTALDTFLCWSPSEPEAARAADALFQRHPALRETPAARRQTWVVQAVEHYGADLSLVDAHFRRMNDTGLPFEDAFAGTGEVGGFDIVEALARRDVELLHVRTRQCEESGENPGSVLMAVAYFLRQVAAVQGALEAQGNRRDLRAAFDEARVPFPSQARVQKALGHFDATRIARFFFAAGPLELNLRTHRDPFGLLAVELASLLA